MSSSDTDSEFSDQVSIKSTSFFEETGNFHRPLIEISENAKTFTRTLKQCISKMSLQEVKSQLSASIEREENLRRELDEIKDYLKELKIKPTPSAPTEDEIAEETAKISFNRHREIRELLSEVREFDGTTDVEAFLAQCRRVNKQMTNDAEKIVFINKVIANKLKGEAIAVADRLIEITPKDFADAMRLAFGKTEKDYSQLSEERNSMRQGYIERVENFVKRYIEMDKRVQKSIDQVDIEFRMVFRRLEDKERINRFTRALKPEIRPLVMTKNPMTLNDAFQFAMYEEKILREDEILRERQRNRRDESHAKIRESASRTADNSRPMHQQNARDICDSCGIPGHREEKCFKKYPHLKNENFQKIQPQGKDPPKKIHEMQESYTTHQPHEISEMELPDSIERTHYCLPDSSARQRRMDYW